jgi:hypothetical protein
MTDILNNDDPTAEVVLQDGRVVRNLTAEEYAATFATGTVHGEGIPDRDDAGDDE